MKHLVSSVFVITLFLFLSVIDTDLYDYKACFILGSITTSLFAYIIDNLIK